MIPRFSICVAAAMMIAIGVSTANAEEPVTIDPAARAAAEKVVSTTMPPGQIAASVKQMNDAIVAETRKTNPQMADFLSAFLTRYNSPDNPLFKTYLSEATEAITAFYAANFTAAELKQLNDFYETTAGIKLREVSPRLAATLAGPVTRFQQAIVKDSLDAYGRNPKP